MHFLRKKNNRECLIENDFLAPSVIGANDEFGFKSSRVMQNNAAHFPIYNEYDKLERVLTISQCPKRNNELKDSTNTSYARGFRRFFHSKVNFSSQK